MKIIINDIQNKEVYPLIVKNHGTEYLTLFYYTETDDCILHSDTHLVRFNDYDQLISFCLKNNLTIADDTCTYDFDSQVIAPTDYSDVLNRWNLLNTISNIFRMYFEGNDQKYNSVYDLLFRYSTSITELPQAVTFNEKTNRQLLKVFQKKDRLINRFAYYDQLS